jgi:hypothetical protein
VFEVIRTILLMSAIRMFDCYRDVPLTFKMVGSMFTEWDFSAFTSGALMDIGLSGADYLVLIIGLIIVLGVSLAKLRVGSVREVLSQKPAVVWYGTMAVMFLVIIVFGAYGVGYDSSQFIYNQF